MANLTIMVVLGLLVAVLGVVPVTPEKEVLVAMEAAGEGALQPCLSHNDCLQISTGHACFFGEDKSGFCFAQQHQQHQQQGHTDSDASSFLELGDEVVADPAPSAGSTMRNGEVHVQAEKGQDAVVKLASGTSRFAIGEREGKFVIRDPRDRDVLTIEPAGDVHFDVPNLHGASLMASKGVSTNGNSLWRVVHKSTFEEAPTGWEASTLTPNAGLITLGVSTCSDISMLGGHQLFNKPGSVAKEFTIARPTEGSAIRITANVHFIDDWSGQSAYLKVAHRNSAGGWEEPVTVWTRQYAYEKAGAQATPDADADLDACGNPKIGEHLLVAHVDVLVPVSVVQGEEAVQFKLVFGSTWEPSLTGGALPGSWGVSALKILSR